MQPLSNLSPQPEQSIDIHEQLSKFLKHWKWIVLSVLVAMVGAYFIIRYSVPQYGMSTTILIKDDKKDESELGVFSDLGIFSGKNNIENETAILSSRTLSQNVIKQLGFNVSYFVEGRIISPESYKNSPVKILFVEVNEALFTKDTSFIISPISDNQFELSDILKDHTRKFAFGQKIACSLGTFMVMKSTNHVQDEDVTVRINSVEAKAAQ
ncbi:MAG: hypothetical protein EOO48_10545, partial [Flavobacterium sp.]